MYFSDAGLYIFVNFFKNTIIDLYQQRMLFIINYQNRLSLRFVWLIFYQSMVIKSDLPEYSFSWRNGIKDMGFSLYRDIDLLSGYCEAQ